MRLAFPVEGQGATGDLRPVAGADVPAFPSPARLREVAAEPPIPEPKQNRLRAVAEAALDGVLHGDRPANEGRLHAAMRALYGLPDASADDLADVAAAWSPFRSWAAVLIRSSRERATAA